MIRVNDHGSLVEVQIYSQPEGWVTLYHRPRAEVLAACEGAASHAQAEAERQQARAAAFTEAATFIRARASWPADRRLLRWQHQPEVKS